MKKKKLAGILLSVSLAAGALAGCSDSEKSGSDGDTIKIGANLELTGGGASYGQSVVEGMELAIGELNKEGKRDETNTTTNQLKN